MKLNQPKAVLLEDYQAPDFLIEKVNLTFEIHEDRTLVRSMLSVNRNQMGGAHTRPLVLQGEELILRSIKCNGEELSAGAYTINEKCLTYPTTENSFILEIETEIYPHNNTQLSGLYRSGNLFCTQCEAEGFRRITYYIDRPDVMAPFSTTISAPRKDFPILLSNGNLLASGTQGDRHWVTWEDPFKKPAYLFALVAGNLAQINDSHRTKSGRQIKLSIFAEEENIKQCHYAMEAVKHSMAWDEEKYGREYDLDIYMIVAVNDFNMGAMENKGLNIFNAKYVLADMQTATDTDFSGVESVIGHEYFHNWTGNRITLRDWFQLSLKEGLTVFREQQFSQDRGSAVVKRIQDVKQIKTRQFAEDSGTIAHPVRPDSYIEINNFYTMTIYYKGAEVIRMLHTLLGAHPFRKGMDLYFDRHDGQAVTIEHFIQAMSDANPEVKHFDFNQFMHWYGQAGTPVVHVRQTKTEDDTVTFTFEQNCPPTPNQPVKKPFVIPIKLNIYETDGKQMDLTKFPHVHQTEAGSYLVLSQAEDKIVLKTKGENLIPSLLGDFSAPVKLEYAYSLADLAFIIQYDKDGFNRWDKSQSLYCQVIEDLLSDKNFTDNAAAQVQIPNILKEVYQTLLHDKTTDPALLAEILTMPSFYYIAEQQEQVDVEKLNYVLGCLRKLIAQTFQQPLLDLYAYAHSQDNGSFEAKAQGGRALKNTCLSLLGRTQHEVVLPLIEKQFYQCRNMTDRMGALSAINHWAHPFRQQLFNDFYQKFKEHKLVVDKWFALQAISELPQTLSTIESLTNHEAFNIKNPNKVYALIRNFGSNNPVCFHEKSGEGYMFLSKQVVALNQQNPQVAARIVEPLTQYKRLEPKHQALMKKALEYIKAQDNLSEDVYEIVSKSLA